MGLLFGKRNFPNVSKEYFSIIRETGGGVNGPFVEVAKYAMNIFLCAIVSDASNSIVPNLCAIDSDASNSIVPNN
jgi:hypothetical protein